MLTNGKNDRIVAIALLSWWVFLLIAAGLIGNGVLVFAMIRTGNVTGTILFGTCFIGACVYLYRTYQARDLIRGRLRD
jgi:hypothetical protein